MEKKNTELEKLFQQENVYPLKKKAIPMLKGFQDGKPVFDLMFITILTWKQSKKYFQVRANTLLKGMRS